MNFGCDRATSEALAMDLLGKLASRQRVSGEFALLDGMSDQEVADFCEPIRQRIIDCFRSASPRLSIVLRARNEQTEILATLASYAFLADVPCSTELIVVDNHSTDQTRFLLECCGVRIVDCEQAGIGYATKAGCDAVSLATEYIFISDADVRCCPPIESPSTARVATFLSTAVQYMDQDPSVMGVSTGTLIESAHWSYWVLQRAAKLLKKSTGISYWAGTNQFIRKQALDAVGGIVAEVGFGRSEDHQRRYQIARWCRENGYQLPDGKHDPKLCDPNYHSGRRHGTLSRVVRHAWYTYNRPKPKIAEDGWPEFTTGLDGKKATVR